MPNPSGNPQNLQSYQSSWRHSPTRQIRVPEVLVDRVLDIAKKLDAGELTEISPPLDIEHAISDILADPIVTRNGRDAGAARRALSALRSRLK
jgi:hypothetical protein